MDGFSNPLVRAWCYRVYGVIGRGTYGVVESVSYTHTLERIAIKRIKNFLHSDGMESRILREFKCLRRLNAHENIVFVDDFIVSTEREAFADVFLVTELRSTKLCHLLCSEQYCWMHIETTHFPNAVWRALPA